MITFSVLVKWRKLFVRAWKRPIICFGLPTNCLQLFYSYHETKLFDVFRSIIRMVVKITLLRDVQRLFRTQSDFFFVIFRSFLLISFKVTRSVLKDNSCVCKSHFACKNKVLSVEIALCVCVCTFLCVEITLTCVL
jgi:hypothetical protein